MECGLVSYGLLLLLFIVLEKLFVLFWWRPRRIQRLFLKQGIKGPPFRPLIGNLGELAKIYARVAPPPTPSTASDPRHNILPHVFPHIHIWREKHGRAFLYWKGHSPRLQISDPELIREFTISPRKFSQSIQHPLVYNLLGKSIVSSGGDAWAMQRRILGPYFFMESLKELSGMMATTTEKLIHKWSSMMGYSNQIEIDVSGEFQNISQYIIAKMIFGNDAEEAMSMLQMQAEQSGISSVSGKTIYIPGLRFLPTAINKRSKWLRKETEKKFNQLIEQRNRDKERRDNDWLTLMLSSNSMSGKQIIDECCAIMVAGSESTNLLMTYACFLLSIHTQWQDKAREEVFQVLNGSRPTMETINQLKILNMIINETLRLYTPLPFVMKHVNEDMKVGSLTIPAGIDVEMPMLAVHHDPMQWGDNFDQFDPSRFAEGVSKASKHPMAFMPFMLGPRVCLGMNFSLIEARIFLSTILQNFAFALSPAYKHELVIGLSLKPKYGAQLLVHKIKCAKI